MNHDPQRRVTVLHVRRTSEGGLRRRLSVYECDGSRLYDEETVDGVEQRDGRVRDHECQLELSKKRSEEYSEKGRL